ncbi:hypothetical protein UFOVP653_62 [uncultured Caudovirales phage]|uniref:Uncharacterized protein n=1 Tax=uncultured Caudovirales phage TaxID=2100421 RepID=A0A6J5NI05_9CAUD|nr:hypothetical protein UFOVP653_62 [uncultured Caudovirales phage]
MATINAPSLLDTVYSGDCPLAAAHGYVTLASASSGDKVRLNKVYAGTKVVSSHFVNAALGASTTVKLGFEYVNGESGGNDAAFIAATSTSSAGIARTAAAPVTLAYDAYIIATIGGGTATGQFDAVVTYEFKGK